MSIIMTVITVSGQTVKNSYKNSDILKTIMLSRQANELRGVTDPNKIQINQELNFRFKDSFDTTYVVKKNDNQWNIVRSIFTSMSNKHGPVIDYPINQPADNASPAANSGVDTNSTFPDWLKWLLIVLVLIALIAFIGFLVKSSNHHRNPVTSGPAQRMAGVNRDNIFLAMTESFKNQNVVIQRIEEGILDSNGHPVKIKFADYSRKRILNDIRGFRATIKIDDNPFQEYRYTLMECGNDIKMGKGIKSLNIKFTPIEVNAVVFEQKNEKVVEQKNMEITSTSTSTAIDALINTTAAIPEAIKQAMEFKTGIKITCEMNGNKANVSIIVRTPGENS